MFHPRYARFLVGAVFVCALVLLTVSLVSARQAPDRKLSLSRIEFVGLQQMTQEQAVGLSGLQPGQQVDVPTLDAAAERLMATGLFNKLSYRYHTTGDAATVTFTVEETKGSLPVVFDNFIWFTPDELVAAVRRVLPTFDGTAPETEGATNSITRALDDLLAARNIKGRVEYMPATDQNGGHAHHVFTVKGVPLPICQLHFPGATDIAESELITQSHQLLEMDYSQENVAAFAVSGLLPLYHRRGHLRANFGAPSARPAPDTNDCKGGADVTLPVTEGSVYLWDKAEWVAAEPLSAPELNGVLNMKEGEVADGAKIERGWHKVLRAYGHIGYLDARLKPTATFDDTNRRVSYVVQLTPGAQYHLAMFSINGLSETDAARVRSAWELAPGAVFDADYLEAFDKKLVEMRLKSAGTKFKEVRAETKADRQRHTVDVVITFK